MHGCVVFDNNAYKRVSKPRMQRIIAAERNHDIRPLANVFVVQELLARVRDPNAETRGPNRAAVCKLAEHCRITVNGKTLINFLSPTDTQFYHMVTGGPHPSDQAMFDELGDTIRVVVESERDDPLAAIAEILDVIERTVSGAEAEYVERLRIEALGVGNPNQMKRNFAFAEGIASRCQQAYGQSFPVEAITPHIIDLMKVTHLRFTLRDRVVAEVRRKGGHGQHRNTIWDEEIVSSTSAYSFIGGKSIHVVTTEEQLVAAAGCSARVSRVTEYEEILGLPAWDGANMSTVTGVD